MIYLTVTETWFLYIGIILGSILLIGLILYFVSKHFTLFLVFTS